MGRLFGARGETTRPHPNLPSTSLHRGAKDKFLQSNFSSPRLARLLGDGREADAPAPRQDFAERLSPWVGVFDAVQLHTAHQALGALEVLPRAAAPSARDLSLADQLQQVKSVLAKAIAATEADHAEPRGRNPRSHTHTVAAAAEALAKIETTAAVDFAPFRKHYSDQQRNMDLLIGPLRASVRQALSETSARLRQLAALDAVWEDMLAPREQRLLTTVPGLLEQRFKQLRKAHLQDDPASARQAGGWLHAFDKEVRNVLLAELDARLEPVQGLIEAFSSENEKYQ